MADNPYYLLSQYMTQAKDAQVDAAMKAADVYQQAVQSNIAFMKQQADQARQDLAPFRAAGQQSANLLGILLGTSPGSTSPIYAQPTNGQFTLNGTDYSKPNGVTPMTDEQIAQYKAQHGIGPNDELTGQDKLALSGESQYQDQLQQYNQALQQWQQTQPYQTQQSQAYQNIINSPATQALSQFGIENINRSAAAKNMLGSGRTTEELFRLGQNIAATQIGATQDRLLQMMQVGQQAAAGSANVSQALGQTVSQQQLQGADAQSNALLSVGQANANNFATQGQLNFMAYQNGFGSAQNPTKPEPNLGSLLGGMFGSTIPMMIGGALGI